MSDLLQNVALVPSEVILNKEIELPLYQRTSDNFFCLSQACRDVGKEPTNYLKSIEAAAVFARLGVRKEKLGKVTLTNLTRVYPNLIYIERSYSVIESGVWLNKEFIPSFYEWAKITNADETQQIRQQVLKYSYIEPVAPYQFAHPEDGKNISIYVRERDRFVDLRSAIDLGRKSIDKLLSSHGFMRLLEDMAEWLNMDLNHEPLNNPSIPHLQRLRQVYHQLYEVQIIEGKQTVWLHPAVAIAISKSKYRRDILIMAIADSEKRSENRYYISQISDIPCKEKPVAELELALFRYPKCQINLIDTPKFIALEVKHPESYWQYTIDLSTLKISIRQDLLKYWGMTINGEYSKEPQPPHSSDFLSPYQIDRTFVEKPQERLIPKNENITFSPKITLDKGKRLGIIEFEQNGSYYRLETNLRFAKSMEQIRQLAKQTLHTQEENLLVSVEGHTLRLPTKLRQKLLQMGYNSPLLPQPENGKATDNIGFIVHAGHKIYYRLSDGFVDANSICKINGKTLTDWLRRDSTWELFAARAKEVNLKFNCGKNHNSTATRITTSFPSLIERKRGSSLSGGGSWIENELAIQLLI